MLTLEMFENRDLHWSNSDLENLKLRLQEPIKHSRSHDENNQIKAINLATHWITHCKQRRDESLQMNRFK